MIAFNYSLVFITRISAHEKKSCRARKERTKNMELYASHHISALRGMEVYNPCEGLRINEPHVAPIFIPQTLFPTERKLPSIYL